LLQQTKFLVRADDALSFWLRAPENELQAPSSVLAVHLIAAVAASTKQQFAFRISLIDGDPIYLEANSAQSCQDWIAAISSCRSFEGLTAALTLSQFSVQQLSPLKIIFIRFS
jgi:hypothetical protein